MVMISKKTMDDYWERTYILNKLFMENLLKTKYLVVKDSPVDFFIHQFICSVYNSSLEAVNLQIRFFCRGWPGREDDKIEMNKLIKEFNSLEETLAFQNNFLEKFTEKIIYKS